MKPCIIIPFGTGYNAYDENEKFICSWYDYQHCQKYVEAQGYAEIPLNSHCAKAILAKVKVKDCQ